MHGNTSHENREIPGFSRRTRSRAGAGAQREVKRRTPLMHEPGKSDSRVVPQKVPNKAGRQVAEGLEGRRLAKEILRQGPELDSVPAEPGALYCPRNALIVSGQRRHDPMWEPCALCGPKNYVASSLQAIEGAAARLG